MKRTHRVTILCSLALAMGCGGRTSYDSTPAQGGSRSLDGGGGLPVAAGSGGRLQAGGSGGFPQPAGSAGQQAVGGSRGLWLPREDFDEVSADFIGSIRQFAVDGSGNVYLASESGYNSTFDFTLARLDADGQVSWTQRISGKAMELTVDDAGTVYQLRDLNGVAVLDRRTPGGQWVWSQEIHQPGGDSSSLRRGQDGALYLGTAWGERLSKFDVEGNLMWTWKGPGERAVSSFAADAGGTVYLRTGVKPDAELPFPTKGQDSPVDGLFWTLDSSGAVVSQRRYATSFKGTSASFVYLETGPVHFALTSSGQLLSTSFTTAGLFETSGEPRWQRDASDLKPGLQPYELTGVLSAGRCGFCITSHRGLFAFDAEGNQTGSLLLNDSQRAADSWGADPLDNVYVLARDYSSQTATLRRYHGESGWKMSR